MTGPVDWYVLREIAPGERLSHSGRQSYRIVHLLVNGKLFDVFEEGGRRAAYYWGRQFDSFVVGEVAHLREFFPGPLRFEKRKGSQT